MINKKVNNFSLKERIQLEIKINSILNIHKNYKMLWNKSNERGRRHI